MAAVLRCATASGAGEACPNLAPQAHRALHRLPRSPPLVHRRAPLPAAP